MSKNQNIPIIIGVFAVLLSIWNTYQINLVMTSQSEQVEILTEEISNLQNSLDAQIFSFTGDLGVFNLEDG